VKKLPFVPTVDDLISLEQADLRARDVTAGFQQFARHLPNYRSR
jgi:hypothetical protein